MIVKITLSLIAIIIVFLSVISFLTRHTVLKEDLNLKLQPCPNTPNCILSTSSVKEKTINAFPLINSHAKNSWESLVLAIHINGGEVLVNNGFYLHAVFTSTIFRFKDDLEAKLGNDHIDIRSASRAGKSDLGQNRKRVERIRSTYLASSSQ